MASPTEIRTPDAETEALDADCAATAAAAARVRLAGAHDCTAVEARLRRATQGLWTAKRFMLRAIMATSLGRDDVRTECNRGLERIDAALREIGGDAHA